MNILQLLHFKTRRIKMGHGSMIDQKDIKRKRKNQN